MSRNKRKKPRSGKPRRGAYILPNLFTTASLFSGFYGMTEAIRGDFFIASLAILASLVFDGLDGKVARATGAVSRFGVEFDSLADLVAFGAGPAVLMYMWALEPLGRLGFLACFLFLACGALRLARFNVQVETVGTSHFVGLPIPAAASVVSTTVLMWQDVFADYTPPAWVLLAVTFALSFLMVSNIRYLSFKEMGLARFKSFNWLVATVLCFILVAVEPQVMGFLLLASYVVVGPLAAQLLSRKPAEHEEAAALEEKTPLA